MKTIITIAALLLSANATAGQMCYPGGEWLCLEKRMNNLTARARQQQLPPQPPVMVASRGLVAVLTGKAAPDRVTGSVAPNGAVRVNAFRTGFDGTEIEVRP